MFRSIPDGVIGYHATNVDGDCDFLRIGSKTQGAMPCNNLTGYSFPDLGTISTYNAYYPGGGELHRRPGRQVQEEGS